MSDENVLEKVKRANQDFDVVIFKMEYKGKILHERNIELKDFQKDVMESDTSFFYLFKDIANIFEEFIIKKHKELVWGKTKRKKESQ